MKTFVFIVLLFSFTFVSPSILANPISNRIFKDLRSYLDKYDEEKALYFLRNHSLELVGTDKYLAHFAQGVLNAKLGFHEEALEEFNKLKGLESLDVYVNFYKGVSFFKVRNYKQAKKFFLKSKEFEPHSNIEQEVRYYLGQLYLFEKNSKEALKNFKPLLSRWRGRAERPKILYMLLSAGLEKNLYSEARNCRWFKKLYVDHPTFNETRSWTFHDESLLLNGKKINCNINVKSKEQRLKRYFWEGKKAVIAKDLKQLKVRDGESDEYKSLQAKFLYLEGDPKTALNILESLEDKKVNELSYLGRVARISYYADQPELSMSKLLQGYDKANSYRKKSEFLFRMAFLNYELKKYNLAEKQFKEVIEKYPKSPGAYDAKWYYPWNLYLSGRFEEAFDGFLGLIKAIKKNPARYRHYSDYQALYWASRSLWKSGQTDKAFGVLKQLVRDPYASYYALLAGLQLKKLAKENRINIDQEAFLNLPWKQKDTKLKNQANNFLESFKLSGRSPSAVLIGVEEGLLKLDLDASIPGKKEKIEFIDEIKNFKEQVKRYKLLARLGFWDDATLELKFIERKTKSSELKEKLISFYEQIEAYKRSSRIAAIHFSKERAESEPKKAKGFWMGAYPKAFNTDVEAATSLFKVPKPLVWGIMRAESFFDQRILSPVGARGLMQLMPFTASQVASLLGQKKGVEPDSLLIPQENIRLGTRYLARLSKKFDGVFPFVAAAYNGGPHRVEWWVYLHGDRPMDEFVELISFNETRGYVKKVMRNYFVYESVYSNGSEKRTDLDFMVNPLAFKLTGPPATKETWLPL